MHVTARNSSTPRFIACVVAVVIMMAGLVFVAAPARATTVSETINGVTYTADDTNTGAGATAVDYDSASGPVVNIPATVNLGGTDYAVKTIGVGAFRYLDDDVTSVTIPNSVTTISAGAFWGNSLINVTIPDSVTTISVDAFAHNDLTNVTIPDSVTTIGNSAFEYNALTNVTIGNSVATIGDRAF
jgi:hypothetical protein